MPLHLGGRSRYWFSKGTGTDVAIEAADVVLMFINRKSTNVIAFASDYNQYRGTYFAAFVYNAALDSYCVMCTLSAIWTATFSLHLQGCNGSRQYLY
ncbi:hypothetical protein [Acinetobacter seifertii]|uniref:hypothetical protein n=1 Tax=Acinetobacter seifertii TaxID=1530123 RepID=UPI003F6F0D35